MAQQRLLSHWTKGKGGGWHGVGSQALASTLDTRSVQASARGPEGPQRPIGLDSRKQQWQPPPWRSQQQRRPRGR